jgi:transcriptional regulator GlxA family with amidase domain
VLVLECGGRARPDILGRVPGVFLRLPRCRHDSCRDAAVTVARQTALAVIEVVTAARAARTPAGAGSTRAHVAFALEAIWERCCEEGLNASDIARDAGLSVWHLSRLVSADTGFGLRQHIRIARLCHAVQLICTTRLSMKEVAARAGIADTAGLDHQFGGTLFMSPGEFLRRAGHSPR